MPYPNHMFTFRKINNYLKFLVNPSNTFQYKINRPTWEAEFSTGFWDYLDSSLRERARSAIIGMYCQHFSKGENILDVGCGLGTLTDFLNVSQKKKYLGIDISEKAIKKAKEYKKASFKNVEFDEFKTTKKFNIIVFGEVLYSMDEVKTFNKVLNLLSKDGKIIISQWKMKNGIRDKIIWKTSKKFFTLVDAIEMVGTEKGQQITWRIEVLKRKLV
jgi:2-polyprenyl-6-hydroxyphenyl methylase/3-demethylubiquinone-9 3-methyltransferase